MHEMGTDLNKGQVLGWSPGSAWCDFGPVISPFPEDRRELERSFLASSRFQCPYQGSASYGPRIESGPLPAFVNKVLLEQAHTHSRMHCLLPSLARNSRAAQRMYGLTQSCCSQPSPTMNSLVKCDTETLFGLVLTSAAASLFPFQQPRRKAKMGAAAEDSWFVF